MATATEFAQAVDALKKSQNELGRELKGQVKEGIMSGAKDLTKPFSDALGSIPGMSTLGGLGKTLFNKGFAALKEKRAQDLLRKQLGLSKEEFKKIAEEKKLSDARKKVNDQLLAASENILGFSGDEFERKLRGVFVNPDTKKFEAEMGTYAKRQIEALEEGNSLLENPKPTAAAKEEADKEAAKAAEERSIFLQIADGVKTLNATFMAKIKEKGKAGLGLVAALIAAPIVAILSFFKELSLQLKLLKDIPKVGDFIKKIGGFFEGIGRFFTRIKNFFKKFEVVKKIGGFIDDVIKGAGRVLRPVGNFFSKIAGFFKTFVGYVKGLVAASGSATGILKFAQGFGKILGKLFLPVTIVMGAFDFITGFIDGFKESEGNNIVSKFIDGVGGGLSKLIGNLIGIPLDLLKSGVSFIVGMLGFEQAEKVLDSFSFTDIIKTGIKGLFNFFSKAVDYIVGIFTGDTDVIGDIVSGFGNIMDTAKQFIKDMLRKILPNPEGNIFSKIASKAIPDAVYEFAGINPDTGEIIPDPAPPPAPDADAEEDVEFGAFSTPNERAVAIAASKERRRQRLEAARERVRLRNAQDELDAGGQGPGVVNAPTVNAPTTNNSSSTTITSTMMKPREPTTQAAIQSAAM